MIIGIHQRTWLRRVALGLAACVFVAGTASQAAAQDPAKPLPPAPPGGDPAKPADATPPAPDPDKVTLNFFRGTEVGGLVDGYYQWYSTKQNGLYRAFDQSHNAFTVSMAELWLAKTPASDSPIGYKIRMNFGEASHVYTPATDIDYKYIEEAYGSYLHGKAQIDFGKFVTNAGAEVVEAKDNWNYTRSLLFQLTIPVYHAGIRMNYTANDKVSFMVGLVNGWNNVVETNTGKTFMASITLKPSAKFSFIENYIGGPETAGTNDNARNLSDTVIMYNAAKVSLMANLDFVGEGGQTSSGFAGYLKYQANPKFAIVPRYEYLSDGGAAFGSGLKQNLQDFTLTLELKGADNFIWRIEYRGDYSDQNVFKTDTGSFNSSQQSIAFGFLYSFSSKS
jgi:Putative beta-barrel porin-2, OmpL-like. bbp2